jgi:hypothetical protein
MMLIDMECVCGARFNVECDEGYSDAAWVLGVRFASCHQKCGFVAPPFMSKENNVEMPGHTPEEDEE